MFLILPLNDIFLIVYFYSLDLDCKSIGFNTELLDCVVSNCSLCDVLLIDFMRGWYICIESKD